MPCIIAYVANKKKLRARNIGKIVNLPYTAKVSKRKILPYGTGNLQLSGAKPTSTNEECGKLPQYGVKPLSISAGSFTSRAEMTCGTPPTRGDRVMPAKLASPADVLTYREKYRKIPKISPGAYIFQRPFLRGLFLEGLIFGGAYVRREIYHFCIVLLCIR